MRYFLKAIIVTVLLASCSEKSVRNTPTAIITTTEQGIPHIKADDMFGLGYGAGYAAAKTDLCAVADALLTYSGKRSSVYGANGNAKLYIPRPREVSNTINDLTINYSISTSRAGEIKEQLSLDLRAVLQGYAEGFNQYLDDTPWTLRPSACNTQGEIPPVSEDDLIKRSIAYSMLLGERFFMSQLYAAAPPTKETAIEQKTAVFASSSPRQFLGAGSNAYAFGKKLTEDGSGLLLANPHYTWNGPERFMYMHLTGPDYDVMGISMLGTPLIGIGFNASMAWTHTVATDAKATLYQLALSPGDPTSYLLDGKPVAMEKQVVTIEARTKDGSLEAVSHTFWETEFGPVLEGPGIPWTDTHAYAVFDPNKNNIGVFEQIMDLGRSYNVAQVKETLSRYVAAPFVNTIATDAAGNALYANMAVTPGFDKAQLHTCSLQVPGAAAYFIAHVMDGSKSTCKGKHFADAPRPGILPASQKPLLIRQDYVSNSNASHWLTNPRAPLTGYSPLIGSEGQRQNARTRAAHQQVSELVASGGKVNGDLLKDVLFSNRNYMAEILMDDLLVICKANTYANFDGKKVELGEACRVLATWDRKDDLNSVGATLFREFLKHAPLYGVKAADWWRIPFDVKYPLHTPRGIQHNNTVASVALAKAVIALEDAGIAIDAPLGEVQYVVRAGKRIPIHGGPDSSVFNVMQLPLIKGKGYTDPVRSGATYTAVVSFDADGPVADAILASGQTTDEASSFYGVGEQSYSDKKWTRLPFLPEAIDKMAVEEPIYLYRK